MQRATWFRLALAVVMGLALAGMVVWLEAIRPENLGRASRIDGMTPAALALLAAHIEAMPRAEAP